MAQFPIGAVIFWPVDTTPPSGWQVCDGSGGTPDLRGREVPGAGGIYAVGDTGGYSGFFSIPAHTHGIGTSDLAANTSFHDWAFVLESSHGGTSNTAGLVTGGDDAPHTHAATSTFDPVHQVNVPPMSGGEHGHPLTGGYDAAGVATTGRVLPRSVALHYIVRIS